MPRYMDFFNHESVTVDNTVGGVALTAGTYAATGRPNAQYAEMTVEDAQIRFTKDGTAPTTSVGHIANVGDIILLRGSNEIARFRAIRTGGTSGVVKASYAR